MRCSHSSWFGASGDLAKKKIYPALFALYFDGRLPENFMIYGYARSSMTTEEFRDKIGASLTCRIDWDRAGGSSCAEKTEEFFSRCVYVPGQYDQAKDFRSLDALMTENERGSEKVKRVFYLSIPPSIFVPVAQNAARECQTGDTRVIVEKPFGRDLQSSRELTAALASELSEEQTYRIDHYLGKELIENLTVLRFSNIMFQPLWNRNYIRNVQINFSENFGTEGRGGYFDNYGIIRDIMQNHLLQILALFAMEEPGESRCRGHSQRKGQGDPIDAPDRGRKRRAWSIQGSRGGHEEVPSLPGRRNRSQGFALPDAYGRWHSSSITRVGTACLSFSRRARRCTSDKRRFACNSATPRVICTANERDESNTSRTSS